MKRIFFSLSVILLGLGMVAPSASALIIAPVGGQLPDHANYFPSDVFSYDGVDYTAEYLDSVDIGVGDVNIHSDIDNGALYVGSSQGAFDGLVIKMDDEIPAVTGGSCVIEYSTSSGWETIRSTELSSILSPTVSNPCRLVNGSDGLTTLVWDEEAFSDWDQVTVNGESAYYVRIKYTNSYEDGGTASQIALLDYNAELTVKTELGNLLDGLELSQFTVTGGEDNEITSFKETEDGVYLFALPASGDDYQITVTNPGFVSKSLSINDLNRGLYEGSLTLAFAHKLEIEGGDIRILEAKILGVGTNCTIDSGIAYCAVPMALDQDRSVTLYTLSYAPELIALEDRTSNTAAQEVQNLDSSDLDYAYKITVKDEDGDLVSGATVKVAGVSCSSLGSGVYGCVVPYTNTSSTITFSKSGYDSETDNLDSVRNEYTDAQVTQTLVLDSNDDPSDDEDSDHDGLSDDEEEDYGTDPDDADTDNDGLEDGEEVDDYDTDPLDKDSDNDDLEDGEEVNDYDTNPNDADTDNDGLDDGEEINDYDTDPNDRDSDNDGYTDGQEVSMGTDPNDDDEHADGFTCSAFIDNIGHWSQEEVCALFYLGFLEGYTTNVTNEVEFRPNQNVTRAEFIKVMFLVAGYDPNASIDNDFTDVPESHWFYPYAGVAEDLGIIDGYSDGSFQPDAYINRAEAVEVMMNLLDEVDGVSYSGIDKYDSPFDDITSVTPWYAKKVIKAYQLDLVEGYEYDDTFRPANNMSRGEMAAMSWRFYVYLWMD